MNVSSVLSNLGVASTGTISGAKVAQVDEEITPTTDVYSSKIAKIAAKYDVTHISLDQIPELARELYNNGLVSGGGALGTMLGMPGIVNILAEDGQSLTGLSKGADGAVDLLGYWKNIASHQRSPEATEETKHATDILEALSSYRSAASGSSETTASTTQGATNLHGAISAYQSGIDNSALDAQKVVNVLEALMSNRNNASVSA